MVCKLCLQYMHHDVVACPMHARGAVRRNKWSKQLPSSASVTDAPVFLLVCSYPVLLLLGCDPKQVLPGDHKAKEQSEAEHV